MLLIYDYINLFLFFCLHNQLRYRNNAVPVFITTDLAAHSQHLMFDRMLQYTEEYVFLPRMQELTDSFITALSRREDAPEQIREQAIEYFQVPQIIMATAPLRSGTGSYYDPIVYTACKYDDIEQKLSIYPQAVQDDYHKIMNAD